MIYNLTDKLNFDEDPVLIVGDSKFTIKSDAETVLKLMDVVQNRGEIAGASEALDIMLSKADKKKLDALHLKMNDYILFMETALNLAMGEDPDEQPGE